MRQTPWKDMGPPCGYMQGHLRFESSAQISPNTKILRRQAEDLCIWRRRRDSPPAGGPGRGSGAPPALHSLPLPFESPVLCPPNKNPRPCGRGSRLAEKEGFEPSIPLWGIHDFQSCALDLATRLLHTGQTQRSIEFSFVTIPNEGRKVKHDFAPVFIFVVFLRSGPGTPRKAPASPLRRASGWRRPGR